MNLYSPSTERVNSITRSLFSHSRVKNWKYHYNEELYLKIRNWDKHACHYAVSMTTSKTHIKCPGGMNEQVRKVLAPLFKISKKLQGVRRSTFAVCNSSESFPILTILFDYLFSFFLQCFLYKLTSDLTPELNCRAHLDIIENALYKYHYHQCFLTQQIVICRFLLIYRQLNCRPQERKMKMI